MGFSCLGIRRFLRFTDVCLSLHSGRVRPVSWSIFQPRPVPSPPGTPTTSVSACGGPTGPREALVITSSLGSGWVRAAVPPELTAPPSALSARPQSPPHSGRSVLRLRRVLLGLPLLSGGRAATWPHHCGTSVSGATSRPRAASLTCALRAGICSPPSASRVGTLLVLAQTDVPTLCSETQALPWDADRLGWRPTVARLKGQCSGRLLQTL